MKCRLIALWIFSFLLILGWTSCQKNESNNSNPNPPNNSPSDSIRVVMQSLNFPWEILWGKDDFIWMTERGGKISKINPETGTVAFSTSIGEVATNGEGGLLGMAQHPDFLSNGYLYIVYDYNGSSGYKEKVVRYTFANNALTDPQILIDNIAAANIHNGSRLWIADGKLFISTGDAGNPGYAQDSSSPNGKILRINLDGSIPADNPVSGKPMWSMGHRNPQGLVLANGILYEAEHGPDVEDEVNIIEKSRNYGWSIVRGPCDQSTETTFCTANNVKIPIWSTGSVTRATSGMDYYNNDLISGWKNSLLIATLKDATLYQLKLSADGMNVVSTNEYFRGMWGRLRDLCVSPAGRVYFCTSNGGNNDKLIEISNLQ